MSRSDEFIVRHANEGTPNGAFGLPRVFKVSSAETGGAFAVWEEDIPEGAGPPLHVHHGQHELFVVLKGRVLFHCDGKEVEVGEGGTVCVPPDTPHTFKGLGSGTSRCLVTLTPGKGADFFTAVEDEDLNPGDHMPRIVEIGQAHGLEFVGPPL